mgnify:CR=1 FL=1
MKARIPNQGMNQNAMLKKIQDMQADMERKQALNISKTLFDSVKFAENHTVVETQQMVENAIRNADGLELEYFEIVDGNTLQKITAWEDTNYAVGCITVFCGDVRLIDNIKLKG